MARVFTVYNCGTGFNRDKTAEVIANLASRTEGAENRDWMINDGPGSAPGSKNSQARTPGLHDPKTGFKIAAPMFAKLKGITEGYGWEQNVQHSMEVIKAIQAGSNDPITRVNMAGWSRGAITCHMLAHALYEDPETRGIEVNIFAFDPVPGPDNFKLRQVSLTSNVAKYLALLAENESRKIMAPVVLGSEDDSRFKIIPLPGAHNTSVMRTKSEVGLIAAYLAHKFLTKRGTKLREPIHLSDRDLCELYGKIRIEKEGYDAMKGSAAQRKLLGEQSRNVPNKFAGSQYFINAHHAKHFQRQFPGLYNAMDAGDLARIGVEAERIKGPAPTTYISLQAVGLV